MYALCFNTREEALAEVLKSQLSADHSCISLEDDLVVWAPVPEHAGLIIGVLREIKGMWLPLLAATEAAALPHLEAPHSGKLIRV